MEVNIPSGRKDERVKMEVEFDSVSSDIAFDEWYCELGNTNYSPSCMIGAHLDVRKGEEGEMIKKAKEFFEKLQEYCDTVLPAKQAR